MAKLPTMIVVLTAALVALLGAGSAAASASAAPAVIPFALGEVEFEAEEEGEEETTAEEECEEAEEEFAEGELSADEVREYCESETQRHGRSSRSDVLAEECVLRSAHGHAAVDEKAQKLKLTIGYTAYEPAAATIDIGNLTTLHRHLGRSGVLRTVESLHGDHLKRLVVRIELPSARTAGCPSRRLVLFPR
jgi:hypothetical protein